MAGEVNLLALAERLKASVTGSCVCDECVLKAEVDAALREAQPEIERLRTANVKLMDASASYEAEVRRLKSLLRQAKVILDTEYATSMSGWIKQSDAELGEKP